MPTQQDPQESPIVENISTDNTGLYNMCVTNKPLLIIAIILILYILGFFEMFLQNSSAQCGRFQRVNNRGGIY